MNATPLATAAPPTSVRDLSRADAELARAAGNGDRAAFERLYRRHAAHVHGTVLRLVGYDHARAEDLVQETFVRAWQKLGQFHHRSAFGTWLYRLAVNTALMALRAQRADPVRMVAEETLPATATVPFCPVERAQLQQAIAALPPRARARARAVLVLHDVEGWRHRDIAAELGMAVGTSKAQLHQARARLRLRLGASR